MTSASVPDVSGPEASATRPTNGATRSAPGQTLTLKATSVALSTSDAGVAEGAFHLIVDDPVEADSAHVVQRDPVGAYCVLSARVAPRWGSKGSPIAAPS